MTIQNKLKKSFDINQDSVAIEQDGLSITYSELEKRANRITRFLLSKDLNKGTTVGIPLSDRLNIIVAMIGVVNAGHVFVLLDTKLPDRRLATIIRQLDLKYVISSMSSLLSKRFQDIAVDEFDFEEISSNGSGEVPIADAGQDDSLYVYFTSGSTGQPKGIVGRNASLVQFVNWEIKRFGLTKGTRFSQFISPYFDAFLRDVFVPLCSGGTVCIPSAQEDFFTPEKIIDWIDRSGINLIHCVPSVFRTINVNGLIPEQLAGLQHVLLSGERIIPSELEKWYKVFDNRIKLINLYGATETTMIRACYEIRPEDVHKTRIPIGTGIDDTELLVADKDMNPCHPLVPGDLYILSNYSSKGYLNAPELTSQLFLKMKLKDGTESIAFRTGDVARTLADGAVDLIGRNDRQVKLRGMRIELDEIENIIFASGLANTALVVLHSSVTGDDSLVAFVTGDNSDTDRIGMIENHVSQYLPDYMRPSAIVAVKEYPMLPNGKINVKALIDGLTPATITAPANETEENILRVWKEILGDKEISTNESFNRAGGNSLGIMRLIGKLYKEYHVRISLSDLFENLTIRKQAELIRKSAKNDRFEIRASDIKPAYQLSSAQERLYFNYLLNKNSTAYNWPTLWQINGEFDKARIEDVFRRLIDRHEALRTEFITENGKPYQVIRSAIKFDLEEIEFNGQSPNDIVQHFIRPFDLSKAPLFHCHLITGSKAKFLFVDFHHIVCDGISHANLLSDFLTLYRGSGLRPLQIQYKDYAEWEYKFKATQEYAAQREFWMRSFERGIPMLELPVVARKTDDTGVGGNVTFEIPEDVLRPMLDHLKDRDLTIFSGLLSAYFVFLSQLTGQEDIVIGTATSGRTQDELDNVVGMFIKTLPIRQHVESDQSFKQFVGNLHDFMVQANSKQAYDLSDILLELNQGRETPVQNLFEAFFVFQNFALNKLNTDNKEFTLFDFENRSAKYPISLFALQSEDKFDFRFEYSTSCFTRTDMDFLIVQFKSLVERICQGLDSSLACLIGNSSPEEQPVDDDITFNF